MSIDSKNSEIWLRFEIPGEHGSFEVSLNVNEDDACTNLKNKVVKLFKEINRPIPTKIGFFHHDQFSQREIRIISSNIKTLKDKEVITLVLPTKPEEKPVNNKKEELNHLSHKSNVSASQLLISNNDCNKNNNANSNLDDRNSNTKLQELENNNSYKDINCNIKLFKNTPDSSWINSDYQTEYQSDNFNFLPINNSFQANPPKKDTPQKINSSNIDRFSQTVNSSKVDNKFYHNDIKNLANSYLFKKFKKKFTIGEKKATLDENTLNNLFEKINDFDYQAITGDGHCLFRAIAYSFGFYLKDKDLSHRNELLDGIAKKISQLSTPFSEIYYHWSNAREIWECSDLNENTTKELVAFLRLLACSYNQSNFTSQDFNKFLSKPSLVYLDEMADMAQACYGGEPELSAISYMLDCEIDVIAVDTILENLIRDKPITLINDNNKFNKKPNAPYVIYLLHYGLHYDLAIAKEKKCAKVIPEIENLQKNSIDSSKNFHNMMIAFHNSNGKNSEKLTRDEILKNVKEGMLQGMNYIDWLFPIDRTKMNTCTVELINELKSNPKVINNIKESFKLVLGQLGFCYNGTNVEKLPNFEKLSKTWLIPNSPYLPAISSILRSLICMDLYDDAEAFFAILTAVSENSIGYEDSHFGTWSTIIDTQKSKQ